MHSIAPSSSNTSPHLHRAHTLLSRVHHDNLYRACAFYVRRMLLCTDAATVAAAPQGESLLMAMKQIAVSSGSACTSASLEPSYVLRALGAFLSRACFVIRHARTRYVGKSQSCMFSNVGFIAHTPALVRVPRALAGLYV